MIAASPLSLPARLAALPLRARGGHRRVPGDLRIDLDCKTVGQAWGAGCRDTGADASVSAYRASLVKTDRFHAYERRFSRYPRQAPLFIMFLQTGVPHAVAAHLY